MELGHQGQLRARFAECEADVLAAQRLRHRAFGSGLNGLDQDDFDNKCLHVLVEDCESHALLCCYRLLPFGSGKEISSSYSAQFYELSALAGFDGAMLEVGRFCIDPEVKDPNVLRVAWAAMTNYVEQQNIQMLFGCSSFHGTDAQDYHDSFALLKESHVAPKRWLPRVKAPKVFHFAKKLRIPLNRVQAMRRMPPLLKTYLSMGGWVSDHAVVDQSMNTLHVFTGLEIRAIPPARKRLLRALAVQIA